MRLEEVPRMAHPFSQRPIHGGNSIHAGFGGPVKEKGLLLTCFRVHSFGPINDPTDQRPHVPAINLCHVPAPPFPQAALHGLEP